MNIFKVFFFILFVIVKSQESKTFLRTKNGIVPIVPCPIGSYRIIQNSKFNNRIDGCIPCPRGRYGSTIGLTSALCSGPCPKGRYGEFKGASHPNDCGLCPFDSYGPREGETNPSCMKCPLGTYNPNTGSSLFSNCIKCPPNYFGNQCSNQLNFQEIIDSLDQDREEKNYQTTSQIIKNNIKNNIDINKRRSGGCGGLNNVCKTQHIVSFM